MKKFLAGIFLGASSLTSFAQWNSNTAINLEVNSLYTATQQAVRTTDGKTWVAYYYNNNNNAFKMYVQLLDVNGNKLLGTNGVLVDDNPSGSATYVYNICTDQEQNLIIGMQDMRTGLGITTVAYKITQTGASVWNNGAGVVLGTGYSPMPALLKSGELAFAWAGDNGYLTYQKLDGNGTAAWATPKQLKRNSMRGQLVPMADNGFVMIYQQPTGVTNSLFYAQRFSNNGDSLWASSVKLSDEATSSSRYYSLRQDADTTYVGYFASSTSNHFDSWLQRINPDGALPYGINGSPFSDYSSGSDPAEGATAIGIEPNSNFVWALCTYSANSNTEYGTYVQKFNKATGQRSFDVLGKAVYPLDAANRYAQQGLVSFTGQHPVFMVVSDVSWAIKGSVLNPNGDFLLSTQDVVLGSSANTKSRFLLTENVNGQSVALCVENKTIENRSYAQNFVLNNLDTSVAVSTVNNVPATINVAASTLNMAAQVIPATISQDVTWSIVPVTGAATISATGVVTAVSDGTVWAKAVSNAATSYADSLMITISNQNTSGISEIEKSLGFSAYPNPTNGVLNVEIKSSHPALTMQVMDINGRIILSQNVAANKMNTPQSLDLKSLPAATYILQVTGEGIHINKKISKK